MAYNEEEVSSIVQRTQRGTAFDFISMVQSHLDTLSITDSPTASAANAKNIYELLIVEFKKYVKDYINTEDKND